MSPRGDAHGDFILADAPLTATLLVSGAEMEAQEIAAGDRDFIVINVRPRMGTLDETIIKGYYTTSRKLNTGTVGKVSSKDISTQPVSNPLAALQGRVSGTADHAVKRATRRRV